jgi:2-polyprenyl-3-methyl-5-hydroxy-6-metoxy-1,4-benzoquinol methylase
VTARLGTYDEYVTEYARYVEKREASGAEDRELGILPVFLELLGEIAGKRVLDAGCGDGYLARILASRGATVTGIDIGPRLIDRARALDPDSRIDYRVANLSQPPRFEPGQFQAIGSYMVLNDVEDHVGFARTIGRVLETGGVAVIAMNSPYAYVLRKGLAADYFASNKPLPSGLAATGINVAFYHRTLGEYLDAFFAAGLRLTKLEDVDYPWVAAERAAGHAPRGEELPHFLVLRFTKS